MPQTEIPPTVHVVGYWFASYATSQSTTAPNANDWGTNDDGAMGWRAVCITGMRKGFRPIGRSVPLKFGRRKDAEIACRIVHGLVGDATGEALSAKAEEIGRENIARQVLEGMQW